MFRLLNLKNLSFLLSGPVLMAILTLGAIPILWPIGSAYEGRFLPVVQNVDIQVVRTVDVGTIVQVNLDKIRSCELVDVLWNGEDGQRSVVVFPEDWHYDLEGNVVVDTEFEDPLSRPTGEQNTGQWLILGLKDLDSSIVTVIHRCHPLWLTYTHFFP